MLEWGSGHAVGIDSAAYARPLHEGKHPKQTAMVVRRSQSPQLIDNGVSPSNGFIGRDDELALLGQLVAAAGHKSIVLRGEAGIGKTRLLREFTHLVGSERVRIAQGSSYPVGATSPYGPVLQGLYQLVGTDQSQRTLLDRLRGLADLQNLRGAQDVRVQRARLFRGAIDTLMTGLSSDPAVLCFEDLQWADVGSLLLINHILDARLANPTVICTRRDEEPDSPDSRALINRIEQRSHVIELRGLPDDAVRRVAWQVLGPGRLTDEEVDTLRSLTRGNPLFLQEVILHLRDSGLLEGHSVAEAIVLNRLPGRLTEVIELRLSSLTSTPRKLLSAASVLGYEFDSATLATVFDKDESEVEAELERAVGAAVLRYGLSTAPGSSRFEFGHPLFAKTLYDSLTATERRALHRAIGDAGHEGRIALAPSELARHHAVGFARTGNKRAVSYCRAAAEDAERLLAFEVAAQFWEMALGCAPRARGERAELRHRLGQALANAGKWPQAIRTLREALAEFEALGDVGRVAELALTLGELHRWRQELNESETWLERAINLLPSTSSERVSALAMLSTIRCVERPEEARLLLAEVSRELDNPQLDPAVPFWVSTALAAVGEPERAHAVAKAGIDTAQHAGAPHIAALLAGNMVIGELGLMRSDHADKYLAVIDEAIADSADTAALIRSLLCRSLVFGYRGEWRNVATLCEQWMADVRLASRYQVATARIIWGEACWALGDRAQAIEAIGQALPDLDQMRPLASMHLARILAEGNSLEEAEELVTRYLKELVDTPRLTAGRVALGDVAASLNAPALWEQCYDLIQGEQRPMVVVYTAVSVQRVLGRLASRLKHWDEAFGRFEAAARELAAGGAAWEQARTLLAHAEARRSRRRRGDDRRAATLDSQAAALLTLLDLEASDTLSRSTEAVSPVDLTGRELDVLALVAEGRRNREIADALTLSERTVERHLESIFIKLEVENRTEAVVRAVELGVVGPR